MLPKRPKYKLNIVLKNRVLNDYFLEALGPMGITVGLYTNVYINWGSLSNTYLVASSFVLFFPVIRGGFRESLDQMLAGMSVIMVGPLILCMLLNRGDLYLWIAVVLVAVIVKLLALRMKKNGTYS
jgi:hypothetical protein